MDLSNKLMKIEALIKGAQTEGEKRAARYAKARLQSKLSKVKMEFSVRVDSPWKKRLFMALCHKHGLHPYRYRGQKRTTTMVEVSKEFMDEVLWPEFKGFSKMFDELSSEILVDLIQEIHGGGEATERVITERIAYNNS